MKNQVLQKFLCKTEDTGRFIVQSRVTGITYFVEPIDNGKPHKLWGDLDPVTKKLTGDYGNTRRGAVRMENSLIIAENGFDNICTFKGSPLAEIERREKEYQRLGVT